MQKQSHVTEQLPAWIDAWLEFLAERCRTNINFATSISVKIRTTKHYEPEYQRIFTQLTVNNRANSHMLRSTAVHTQYIVMEEKENIKTMLLMSGADKLH